MNDSSTIFMITLVMQFWISGLFILSVIFLDIDYMDDLTLCTFISYAVGSFIAGMLSDKIGRRPLFILTSILLFFSSILLLWSWFAGFVLANLCIGPLNNLTFVFINENDHQNSQINTIKVLVGWAASEITLGLFFYFVPDKHIFFYSLVPLSFIYALLALFFTTQTKQFIARQEQLQQKSWKEMIIPKNWKPIIGGGILMFMMQIFYYRTQFSLDKFGVSLEINTMVVGFAQIFANLSFWKIIKVAKRRLTLQLLICILSALLCALIFLHNLAVQTAIEGTMRIVDTAIMLVLGVYLPQLFLLQQRGKGTNMIMSFGVLGSALNGKIFTKLSLGYLQFFLFVAFISTFIMPETKYAHIDEQNLIMQNIQDTQS